MGWWRTGTADDVIGDGPIDRLLEAFDRIANVYIIKKGNRPTIDEILDGILYTLNTFASVLLENGDSRRIRKFRYPGGENAIADSTHAPESEIISCLLVKALTEITQDYKDSIDRRPRFSETLDSIKFALGSAPQRFVDSGDKKLIQEISVDYGIKNTWLKREAFLQANPYTRTLRLYRDRILRYETERKLNTNYSDHQIWGHVIAQNQLFLFIARYSYGEDIFELRRSFPILIGAFERCSTREPPPPLNFDYLDGYIKALWLVSIGLLIDLDNRLFHKLIDIIGQTGKDALYDRLVSERIQLQKFAETLLYPLPYTSLYEASYGQESSVEISITKFLQHYYPSMKETYWYDLHLRNPVEFFGYWCFELAALVKCLNLNEVAFADNYYYPRDLAGRRLFKTWEETKRGEADRFEYQKLRKSFH